MQRQDIERIDPANMAKEQQRRLGEFLKSNEHENLVDARYTHNIMHYNETSIYRFKLNNHLLRRQRKEGKEGARFEVVSNTLGSGGEATVYLSIGTISEQNGLAVFKPKMRVIKEFYIKPLASESEYHYTFKMAEMHIKPLVHTFSIFKSNRNAPAAYLIKKYIPGKNLREITTAEMTMPQLNTDQIIQLSIDILLAIQDLHRLHLIHLDIKPQNIIVDDESKKPTLIDLSYCQDLNDSERKQRNWIGTPMTMPQEQFKNKPCTVKTDCYSAGKTLAELWGAVPEAKKGFLSYSRLKLYSLADTKYLYTSFREGDLSDSHAARIKTMLEQLTRSNPEDRWTLEQAISSLQNIQQERAQLIANPTRVSGKL